jgi:hypothetical protein
MLMDWYLTEKKIIKGNNPQRIATGFLFGMGYIIAIISFFIHFFEPRILLVSGAYALVAIYLIHAKHLK